MTRRLHLTHLESRLAPAIATWDGGGIDNNWTTDANWVGDVQPSPGDDLVFPVGAARLTNVNDFAAGTTFASLALTGGSYVISGDAFNVTSGVSVLLPASAISLLDLPIGGGGGLTKSGAGVLRLRGANSYLGQTVISDGSVIVNSSTGLGASGAGNDTVTTNTGRLFFHAPMLDVSESISISSELGVIDQSVATFRGPITLIGLSATPARFSVGIECLVTITSGIGESGSPHSLDIDIHGFTGSTVVFAAGSVNSLTGNLNITHAGGGILGRVYFLGQSTAGAISIENDAIIGGTGPVGPVTVLGGQLRGGIIGAGEINSIGTLTLGSLNVTSMGQVALDLNSMAADRLVVSGTVQIAGTLGFVPAVGTVLNVGTRFRIIDNDGTDAVQGTFAGAPEGSVVQTIDRRVLLITYRGGDGNDVELVADHERMVFAAGADATGQPFVQIYGLNSKLLRTIMAYDPLFTGGVRVATADITGDGVDDLITAPGAGGGPHIKVFDGLTFEVVSEFMAYNVAFTGGVFVAAGDVNRDNRLDVITGAGAGGGPHVKAFNGLNATEMVSFMAYDIAFTGGVTVASNSNGAIITGPGPGGGPHIKIFFNNGILDGEFFAFDPSFRGGVFVSSLQGTNQFPDPIVMSAGPGGGPHVRVFGSFSSPQFFAYAANFTGGVRIAGADVDGDGTDEIVTSPGPGGGPHIEVWKLTGGSDELSVIKVAEFLAFASFPGGVFVG